MSDSALVDHSLLEDRRYYLGVRSRRVFAFLIDYAFILLLCIPAAILVFFIGLFTLGLGWFLYGALLAIVALPYVAVTLGGPNQATPGMRAMGLAIARLDRVPMDPLLAIVHTVLFWAANVILTPLILLATLFLDRKRLAHDLLLGTVVYRADL